MEYDGAKYIEMYSPHERRSLDENLFDGSLENGGSQEPMGNHYQLNQSSVHSNRSTKSASFIPMRLLVKKNSSGDGMVMEKKTSFGNLTLSEKKHSAQSLGIKSGSSFVLNRAPVVNNSLKPATPSQSTKAKLGGFALLKAGASVLRTQIDENGSTWYEYQAAGNGPVFYVQEGGLSAGQWQRPAIFDLEEFSSASVVSVEPVDFGALDEALISRPSSKRELLSGVNSAANSFQSKGSIGDKQPVSSTTEADSRDKVNTAPVAANPLSGKVIWSSVFHFFYHVLF